MNDLKEKAKILIEKVPYITIASVTKDGLPWNSPVFAVYDEEYNFYWNSAVESQHSKNIKANNNVFVVIYDTSVSEGQGFGVYIQGEAKELGSGLELEKALNIFYNKKNKEPKPQENFLNESSQRFYKLKIIKCWVNIYDKNHTPPDYKEEIIIG